MQSQSWVLFPILLFSRFQTALPFPQLRIGRRQCCLLSFLLHFLIIHPFSGTFRSSIPKLGRSYFHKRSLSFSDRSSSGPSFCSSLSSAHCFFSSLFLLVFRFSSCLMSMDCVTDLVIVKQHVLLHAIISKSLSLYYHSVLFLVPFCLSFPVGELSSPLFPFPRPNPAVTFAICLIIFNSLSLSQVLFLVPLCLSSPVGELSSLLSLSSRPNPALPPALLASTG